MSSMRAIPIPDEALSSQTYPARAYAAQSPTSGMATITIPRRTPQPKDVQIEILYCGVCHTDVTLRAQRFCCHHADHLSLRARPRDRWTRSENR